MKNDSTKRLVIVISFIAIVLLVIVSVVSFNKSRELASLRQGYSELYLDYNKTVEDVKELNESFSELESRHDKLLNDYSKLAGDYSRINDMVYGTISRVSEFKQELRDKMQWYRNNSNTENTESADLLNYKMNKLCIRMSENLCEIKLVCLAYLAKISYRYDADFFGEVDFIQSIENTINKGYGDCEDVSLLFTAQYNYVYDRCIEKGYNNSQLKLITIGGGKGIVYPTFNEEPDQSYFTNAEEIELDSGYVYAYPVCGGEVGAKDGHCVVAFMKNEIKNSSDIGPRFEDIILTEPQNYASFTSLENIGIIILKDDILLYNNSGWISYSHYYNVLDKQEEKLNWFINGKE